MLLINLIVDKFFKLLDFCTKALFSLILLLFDNFLISFVADQVISLYQRIATRLKIWIIVTAEPQHINSLYKIKCFFDDIKLFLHCVHTAFYFYFFSVKIKLTDFLKKLKISYQTNMPFLQTLILHLSSVIPIIINQFLTTTYISISKLKLPKQVIFLGCCLVLAVICYAKLVIFLVTFHYFNILIFYFIVICLFIIFFFFKYAYLRTSPLKRWCTKQLSLLTTIQPGLPTKNTYETLVLYAVCFTLTLTLWNTFCLILVVYPIIYAVIWSWVDYWINIEETANLLFRTYFRRSCLPLLAADPFFSATNCPYYPQIFVLSFFASFVTFFLNFGLQLFYLFFTLFFVLFFIFFFFFFYLKIYSNFIFFYYNSLFNKNFIKVLYYSIIKKNNEKKTIKLTLCSINFTWIKPNYYSSFLKKKIWYPSFSRNLYNTRIQQYKWPAFNDASIYWYNKKKKK